MPVAIGITTLFRSQLTGVVQSPDPRKRSIMIRATRSPAKQKQRFGGRWRTNFAVRLEDVACADISRLRRVAARQKRNRPDSVVVFVSNTIADRTSVRSNVAKLEVE